MKTFQMVVRKDEESQRLATYIKEKLKNGGMIEGHPQIVIVLGGDGTMLEAFHQFRIYEPYFVCVGTGTLGFYADWEKTEVDILLHHILHEEERFVSYPLLEVSLKDEEGHVKTYTALNEMVIKSNTTSTFIMNTYLNEELFQCFRGDGMVFATPSGSTGYNHSLMGSIVHPSIECVQITEIAAINNKVYKTLNRPFILPKHHKMEGTIESDVKNVVIGIDGQHTITGKVKTFSISVSKEKVKFMRYRNLPFWNRVKDKLM